MTETSPAHTVYSDTSAWCADPDHPEGGRMVRLTWAQVAAEQREQIAELQGWRTMVADLDRNANGRHEGDADTGDPTGVSHGNPLMPTGTVIGHSLGGSWQYVMPDRAHRHDLAAWRRPAERPQEPRP